MEKIEVKLQFAKFGLVECPQDLWDVTPKHPKWRIRVKFEVEQMARLLEHFKKVKGLPWFKLQASDNPKYNFMIWKGCLWVPNHPEINFDMATVPNAERGPHCDVCIK